MQKRMLIFLQRIEPMLAHQVVLDEKNQIIQVELNAPLQAYSDAMDITVFLPASDVLLTQVNLPKLSKHRLLQALPFALEEQLLDDVENLHFAIGNYQPDSSLPVAVVAKQKMTTVLNALQQNGLSPTCLTSAVFALPYVENLWFVYATETTSIIRTGQYSGFACENENFDLLLDLRLSAEKEKENIQIIRSSFEDILETRSSIPINLLQGAYRKQKQAALSKSIWLLAATLTATWIALTFLSHMVSFFILHAQTNRIEAQINQIYKRQFPQATTITAPKQRMEEKLKTAFAQANKNNFLALLSLIARSTATNQTIFLQNLEFHEKQITLEVSTNRFDNLDLFTTALTKQGLQVKRQSAATAGTQIKANLLITVGDT